METNSLEKTLGDIGLGFLYNRFKDQKIEYEMVGNLTDRELIQLGVETIGDRARLRHSTSQTTPASPATDSFTGQGSSTGV